MRKLKIGILSLLCLLSFGAVCAQKKVRGFTIEKVLDLPAGKIWEVIGGDYGAIANSHPTIVNSEYTSGSLKGAEGAERVCYFNNSGSKYLHERMVNFDPANMTFKNTILRTAKFPVDPEYTYATYRVEDLGNGTSKISVDLKFRAKPAIMSFMMRKPFIKLMEDYFIAIEHYVKTGESVTKDNFKSIKKKYSNNAVVL